MTDAEIMKRASGGGRKGAKDSRPGSAAPGGLGGPNLQNEWIPTEAVRVVQKIKETFGG